MDRAQIDAEHVLTRYLAGEMSADDEAQFEAYAARNPDIYREIEIILRMKEGFATLQDKGQLEPLLRERRSPLLMIAAAAAVGVLTFGVWIWHELSAPAMAILARAPADFVSSSNHSLTVSASYVLIQTRKGAPPLGLKLPSTPGVIELQIMPSVYNPHGLYKASIMRTDGNVKRGAIREIEGLTAAPDRYVTVYLDSARLVRGEYEISIGVQTSSSADIETDHFPIHVR